MHALAAGVLVLDADGQIIDMNPECHRLLGVPQRRMQEAGVIVFGDADGAPLPEEQLPGMTGVRTGRAVGDLIFSGEVMADGSHRATYTGPGAAPLLSATFRAAWRRRAAGRRRSTSMTATGTRKGCATSHRTSTPASRTG